MKVVARLRQFVEEAPSIAIQEDQLEVVLTNSAVSRAYF